MHFVGKITKNLAQNRCFSSKNRNFAIQFYEIQYKCSIFNRNIYETYSR